MAQENKIRGSTSPDGIVRRNCATDAVLMHAMTCNPALTGTFSNADRRQSDSRCSRTLLETRAKSLGSIEYEARPFVSERIAVA